MLIRLSGASLSFAASTAAICVSVKATFLFTDFLSSGDLGGCPRFGLIIFPGVNGGESSTTPKNIFYEFIAVDTFYEYILVFPKILSSRRESEPIG